MAPDDRKRWIDPITDGLEPTERVKVFEKAWVDPFHEDTDLTSFELYPQPSRLEEEAVGSYRLYLPPSYHDEPERRFPVLFFLHGGFQNQNQDGVVEIYDRGIRQGLMPEHVIVVPQGLPIGWFIDSRDNARPIEQVMIRDLIPHIDATLRTIPTREARGIDGFSMGGFGSYHLGFKYPDLFEKVSACGPSIIRDLDKEPPFVKDNSFFGDKAYHQAVAPWTIVRGNAPRIRATQQVRLVHGTDDHRLAEDIGRMHQDFLDLDIPVEYHEAVGATHVPEEIIGGIGDDIFTFWRA